MSLPTRRPITMTKFTAIPVESRATPHASLAILGSCCGRSTCSRPFAPSSPFTRSRCTYTPFDKLSDCFIGILAGAKGIQDINRVLRDDPALQAAFGREGVRRAIDDPGHAGRLHRGCHTQMEAAIPRSSGATARRIATISPGRCCCWTSTSPASRAARKPPVLPRATLPGRRTGGSSVGARVGHAVSGDRGGSPLTRAASN